MSLRLYLEAGISCIESYSRPDVNDVVGAGGLTFGQFTKEVISRHYENDGPRFS